MLLISQKIQGKSKTSVGRYLLMLVFICSTFIDLLIEYNHLKIKKKKKSSEVIDLGKDYFFSSLHIHGGAKLTQLLNSKLNFCLPKEAKRQKLNFGKSRKTDYLSVSSVFCFSMLYE